MLKQTLPTKIAAVVILLTAITLGLPSSAGDPPGIIAAEAYGLRMVGQVEPALKMLTAGLETHPEAGVLFYELARTKLFLLDIPGMREAAEAAVRFAPDNNEFRYFAALAAGYALIDAAHHQDKDRMKTMGDQIVNHLETILESDPDHSQARYLLVQQSVEMAPEVGVEVGDPEAHIALLEAKDPVLGAKARCCLVDQKEQQEIWEKVLAENPEDCRALMEAADGLITAGELDLAAECLDKAIGKEREACYGLLRLGLAYSMKHDWDRAEQVTQQYLDLNPPVALKAYATGRMGMIQRQRGDEDGSREWMARAHDLDPHVWQTVMPPPREIFTPI